MNIHAPAIQGAIAKFSAFFSAASWKKIFSARMGTTSPEKASASELVAKIEARTNTESDAEKRQETKPTTLASLLDSLDTSFETMRVPETKGNWLSKEEVRSIKKIGMYVPASLDVVMGRIIPADVRLPAIASCFLFGEKHDTKDRVCPRFAFAIKQARLSPHVELVHGTPYKFGVCYSTTESETSSKRVTFWVYAWAVVRPGGEIVFPSEKRSKNHTVRLKRRRGGHSTTSFTTSAWVRPSILKNDDGKFDQMRDEYMAAIFRQLVVWWAARGESWSVGVRKGDWRATFAIDPENTKTYFADRDLSVDENGRRKKIIHYVKEHTRSNGSHVKAHVRGAHAFSWRGYRCVVTAPRLRGAVFTDADLSPVELADTEAPKETFLTTDELASRLANLEDNENARNA